MSDVPAPVRLEELRRYFAGRLPERLREVEAAWAEARGADIQGEPLARLHRLVHSLAGAGGTFGYPGLTAAARALERQLKGTLGGEAAPAAEIAARLAELWRAAEEPATPFPTEPHDGGPAGVARQRVVVLDGDPEQGEALALQLRHFGYEVAASSDPAGFRSEVERIPPAALVVDIALPGDPLGGATLVAGINRGGRAPVKTVFLASRSDLEARLTAVRAGGDAYFVKPFNTGTLVERLDLLTERVTGDPFRVLVVEDDPDLARFYVGVLAAAGLDTALAVDPLTIMTPLAELKPDVILLDVHMPGCTGPELAAVLRQQESTFGTPIVFLSSEGEIGEQLAALAVGGDEFLTKPIDPAHLVEAVKVRARRGRQLASLIAVDGLTGLYNHGNLRQRIVAAVARAERQGSALAYAMMDVDRFKNVNDTFGHAVGDGLLRHMAMLLKQRLRRSDVIGRYGGDEFGVLLSGADGPTARRVLDEVRGSFAALRHRSGDREIAATMSCGISTFPRHATPEALVEAADAALYEAKRQGRNRVVLEGG